jgi:predicted ATPase
LWQGRRTAPPRQQTLSATLDWSFRLLGELERMLLCRLSIFVGTFTLEDANAVAANERLTELEIAQHLGSLVNRCLIAVDLAGKEPNYRLLDMTREFVHGKIETEQEASELARQHARCFLRMLTEGTAAQSGQMTMRQKVPPASRLGNIVAALEWCFSSGDHGDTHLGQHLISASGRFLLSQGLTFEFRKWAEMALARLGPPELGSRLELQLHILLASARTLAEHDIRSLIVDRAITLAHDLGERRLYRTLLYERRYDQAFWGEPEIALQAAINLRAELSENGDPIELAIAEATVASISHTFGTDLEAHRHFKLAFAHLKDAGEQASDLIEESSFRRIRSTYANNLYTCGLVDQAAAIGQEFIDGFDTAKDYMAYREIMPRISFIFEWRQEWHKVAQIYNTLLKYSVGQPDDDMNYVHSIMRCKLLIQSGEFRESMTRLQEHYARVPPLSPGRFILFVPLCEALIGLGQEDEALAVIEEALNYESTYSGSGFRSEYLLCKANILTAMPGRDAAEIETVLRQSLDAARRQTSLSREIDAALALAELLHHQHRASEGRAVLKPVYDRFTEGFTTKALVRARELLDELDSQG